MTTRTYFANFQPRTGEVVRSVSIISDVDRGKDLVDYHVFKAGIATKNGFTPLWTFDQSKQALTAREFVRFSGQSDANWPLGADGICALQVIEFGKPTAVDGVSVEFRVALYGDVRLSIHGDRYEISSPLVATGEIEDQHTRAAVQALEGAVNTILRPDHPVTIHPTQAQEDLRFNSLETITSVDAANDYVIVWDATDSRYKKVLRTNL